MTRRVAARANLSLRLFLPWLLVFVFAVRGAQSAAESTGASGEAAELLARALRATGGDGAPQLFAARGTLQGEGLEGTFTLRFDGTREQEIERLGARELRTTRLGARFYREDGEGNAREITGEDRLRLRTSALIENGAYLHYPQWVSSATDAPPGESCLVLRPPESAPATLCFDNATSLLRRATMTAADGIESTLYDDWRPVGATHYPFRTTVSNGDPRFHIVATVTSFDPKPVFGPDDFPLGAQRTIGLSAPVTVPLEIHDDHLYVAVQIAGKTYHFLLDSGSQQLILDRRVADALGLRAQGDVQLLASTRAAGLGFVNVPDLAIGDAHLRDRLAAVADLGTSSDGSSHLDGVLGYPLFAAAAVRIDMQAATVTIAEPRSLPPEGVRLTLDVDRGVPETRALIGGISAPVLIDTGNSAALLLYRPFVEAHPGIFTPGDHRDVLFGVDGTVEAQAGTLDEFVLGGVLREEHVAVDAIASDVGAFADRIDAGSVGMGLLAKYRMTLDETDRSLSLIARK